MSSEQTWELLRLINFSVLFIAFIVMVYKGALNFVLQNAFHWDRLLNISWVILAIYSLGEVIYMNTPGGLRVIAQTGVALLQLYVVLFHFKVKTEEA